MRFLPLLSILALLATPVSAEHCTTYSTSQPEVDVLGTYYVDAYVCDGSPDCLFTLWVYQESNGFPGLQRADEESDDTCHGMIESDTIFF